MYIEDQLRKPKLQYRPRESGGGILTRLFNGAFDFRVLSGRNQPPRILPGEHKYAHTASWFLRSGVAQQLLVHMRDGDFLPQEANIDFVELQRAEDSEIRAILFAESWRILRNYAVDVGMLRLDCLPACP